MSFFSNVLQTLHTILGKTTFRDASVVRTAPMSDSAYQQRQEQMEAIKKPGDRSYIVKSLWHNDCSRCDYYTSKSLEEIEQEQGKLCVENYQAAFRAFKHGFTQDDDVKVKYPALSSDDNVRAIKTIYMNWGDMFPSLNMNLVSEDIQFLMAVDQHIVETQQQVALLLENYEKAIKALARIASFLNKPMISELIQVFFNEKEFYPDANEPFTVMCWGGPSYVFVGGPLSEKQIKWMKFAVNVAHVPEKESDQIIMNGPQN